MKDEVTARRLPEIDALRGIAALSVLVFHYSTQFGLLYRHAGPSSPEFNAGRYGVQLFFVISGFVIFWSLDRTRDPSEFIGNRFARLFPTYWLALVITFGLVTIAGLPGQRISLHDALLNLTMVPEFLDVRLVDGSYWTLQVELFFYLQMLLWFVLGALRRYRLIIAGWLVLACAYGVAAKSGDHLSYTLRELLIVRYSCYFAAGILMYRMRVLGDRKGVDWLLLLGTLVAAWVTWGWIDAAVLLGYMILFSLMNSGRLKILNFRPLLFVGAISYPLYLLHQEIGYILIAYMERSGLLAVPSIIATTALMIGGAWLLSTLVERPADRVLRKAYVRFRVGNGADASKRVV